MFLLASLASAAAATIYRHQWGTVADVMGMHGQGAPVPPSAAIDFAAQNYAMITTAAQCVTAGGGGAPTIEDGTLAVARSIKKVNPAAIVGMYWRTDMALEIALCSNFTAELKSHGDDYYLRDDHGNLALKHGDVMWDYSNKEGVALFRRALVNVVKQTEGGKPLIDYIFLDGPRWNLQPNISAARNAQLEEDKYEWFAELQDAFNAIPGGRNAIMNSLDDVPTAKLYHPTGAAGAMVDHWSILQFLLRDKVSCPPKPSPKDLCGHMNPAAMDALFTLVRSKMLANMTLQVKGWVGPVMAQQGIYPPQMHTPTPGAERRAEMARRFNSELALFLLVAEDHMYWMYSWFWAFDSWVPNEVDSDVPSEFFPQAKCALGKPKGPPVRNAATSTYTRKYEHASVFVDLTNRTACTVTFTGAC